MFFIDGKRRIDYILAWASKEDYKDKAKNMAARKIFEDNLNDEGLELEYDLVCFMLKKTFCTYRFSFCLQMVKEFST